MLGTAFTYFLFYLFLSGFYSVKNDNWRCSRSPDACMSTLDGNKLACGHEGERQIGERRAHGSRDRARP